MTLSSARWCGMIRCASAEMSRREVSTPRSASPSISPSSTLGSMTTPLPITGVQPGRQDPRRDQVQRVLLAVRRDHRVAGVVAALVADDVGHAAAEQVGDLALALVAPLGADQHDRWHRVLVLLGLIGHPAVPGWVRWQGIRMSVVELDLRRLEPGRGPPPERRRRRRGRPTPLVVRGPVPALAAVLTALLKADRTAHVPVAWEPAGDKDSLALARDLGVGTGERARPRPGPRRPRRRAAAPRPDRGRRRRPALAEPPARAAGPPRRHQGGRRRDHPDRRPPRLAGGGHHRRDRDDCSRCARRGTPAAARCRWPPTRRGSSGTASRTRARSPAGPGTPTTACAGGCSPESPAPRRLAAGPCRCAGRGHWAHPARRGGPAADVLRPDRAPAAPGAAAGDHRSPAHAGGVAGRDCRAGAGCWAGRWPGRACPPSSGSWSCVVFFGVQAPGAAHRRRPGQRPGLAALLGIGAVAVALLLIAGQFDLSIGVVAVASSLVTALLIEHAGWGTWPALAGLARRPRWPSGLVNGLLVVNTGLPSFLVTLATFLVLQGTSQAGVEARRRVRPGDRAGGRRGLGVGRRRVRLDPAARATAASGSRCCGGSRRTAAGHLGAVAHPLRQRRLRQRRRAPGRPPARRPGPADDGRPCSASPPRPAG